MTPLERVLAKLPDAKRDGKGGFMARCPAHDDSTPSLHVSEGTDGRVLVNDFGGCDFNAVCAALELEAGDLFPPKNGKRGGGGVSTPGSTRATVQTPPGLTLRQYAEAKKLPLGFLEGVGLSDVELGSPVVRIRYADVDGNEAAVRFRLRLEKDSNGDGRFRWRKGSHAMPYGLERLAEARTADYLALVEGESDCHTLWHHGVPALGVPGATTWQEAWATHLADIATIFVVVEPDAGGAAVKKWLAASSIRDRVRLVSLGAHKDPSALHCANVEDFPRAWRAACEAAVPWAEEAEAEAASRAAAAWAQCASLAEAPDILQCLVDELPRHGAVGEERAAKLVYLATTSRLLARPVSLAIKGPSSGGKSFTVECVLRLFPASAYYALSAVSERALAYSPEPLAHRILVIFEAAGLTGETASYLVRSLLSEGCIRYETVEKTSNGLEAKLIERPGPTGLIVTTTAIRLHAENETRLLSVPVDDSQAQTRRVLEALAGSGQNGSDIDVARWHALQTWLEMAAHRVDIPFAQTLAKLVPPVAVRLRRDFALLLNLVRAHALLHQATRERVASGAVLATVADYAAVRELVVELVGEAVQATVRPTVRETVIAVAKLAGHDEKNPTTVSAVAKSLKLDTSAASRRVHTAIGGTFVRNLETRKGQPAKLVLGEPLPAEQEVLPLPEALEESVCTVARSSGGVDNPPPPPPPSSDALTVEDVVAVFADAAAVDPDEPVALGDDRDALLALAAERDWPMVPLRPGVNVIGAEPAWRKFARKCGVADLFAARAYLERMP
jgi:hypothetical protein